MRVEHADLSLLGARESNQDRVGAEITEAASLLIACDGMGGHAEGERAVSLGGPTADNTSAVVLRFLE